MRQNQNTVAAIDQKHANSWPSLTFSPVVDKHWQLSRGYFGSWGHALVAVAVVERWPLWRGLNKSKCVDCPPGQNKVAVVQRWPLVEVRLCWLHWHKINEYWLEPERSIKLVWIDFRGMWIQGTVRRQSLTKKGRSLLELCFSFCLCFGAC